MKGITEDFLLFIVGIFVILIILVTVFGRGIAFNVLSILSTVEPSYLQEDLRTFLTVASYSPGEYEAKIKINLKHTVLLNDTTYPTVFIDPEKLFKFSNTTPLAFLTTCSIDKACTKICGVIGDPCASHTDCCGSLSCTPEGACKSTTTCNNGVLDFGEECDAGKIDPLKPQCNDVIDNDGVGGADEADTSCHTDGNPLNHVSYDKNLNEADKDCPGKCQSDCTCPKDYKQCDDNWDNNLDGKKDKDDPNCHTDFNETNTASWRSNRHESRLVGEVCSGNSDCWRFLSCTSKIKFNTINEVLVIKKYFENNECKIKIEKETT